MKVFIAGLATETNSFSPIPTGRLAFKDTFVSRNATQLAPNLFSAPLHEWRKMSEKNGWDVFESLCAFAQPAGPTIRETYEGYRDEILADIEREKPDIVLMSMHGAMIAEGYDDCEGDFLARARDIVGSSSVIGLEIDPHSHLTEAMLSACDLIIAYKEYPHTDSPERARELFALAAQTASGKIRPIMRDYDCKMIAMYHTPKQPMRRFVDQMSAKEKDDKTLSLSLIHGFPWGDCARVGTRVLAITDNDENLAAKLSKEFGEELWSLREQIRPDWPTIDQALNHVEKAQKRPIVLADFADNAGGGAPADSTFVLERVLAKRLHPVAIGIFFDPLLVRMCLDAGIGSSMQVRIGGKTHTTSGNPVDLDVKVRAIKSNMKQMMGDTQMEMGTGVWLEHHGVHMIVSDKRTQVFHPVAFTELGLDLNAMRAIIVKSSQHFYAGFEPIATEIIHLFGPGAITPDYANIPFTKRSEKYWPKFDDPGF